MKHLSCLITVFFILIGQLLTAQPYILDISKMEHRTVSTWLKGGGKNQQGDSLSVNTLYLVRDGKPWFPVMGEIQHQRYPASEWEASLLKAKAAGISIIATYVLWNIAENPQGHWNWTGNDDLQKFIQLCKKHGLYVWLRIGPYCNAESRNGGLPDWIAKQGSRTNAAWYMDSARVYYSKIAAQTEGLYFKDGGPIIGVQIENEFVNNSQMDHISDLKFLAIQCGIIAPFYSVTNNSVCRYENGDLLPMQGVYPYRGWDPNPTKELLYSSDEWGALQNFGKGGLPYNGNLFPRLSAELGAGCWQSYHDRFYIPPYDAESLLQNVIGRGVNMPGYYIFQGETQRQGLEKDGLPVTYDFQAPIDEYGRIRPSYRYLKILHHFINDFGEQLATMQPVRPDDMVLDPYDTKRLRYAGRFNNNSGFVFVTNCQPFVKVQLIENIQFIVKLENENITFPSEPFTLKENISPVFPINFDLNGTTLKYSTAQLLCKVTNNNIPYYFFFVIDGVKPEFAFDKDANIETDATKISGDKMNIFFPESSYQKVFSVTASDGRKARIVLLSRKDAENSWRLKIDGIERLILSDADITQPNDGLEMRSISNVMNLFVFPSFKKPLNKILPEQNGIFSKYSFVTKKTSVQLNVDSLPANTWSTFVPKVPGNVSNLYLEVNYCGSTADVFVNNKKYSDNYNNGTLWNIGLLRFDKGDKITIKPIAWDSTVKGIPASAVPRTKSETKGIMRSINIVPEYRIRIKCNKE